MKNLSVKDLVLMAFYVALFMVLDTFVNTLGIFQMPNGGSLGVSTLALLMASYHLGWKKGLFVSVVSVFAQFVTGPMYTPDLLGFLLDYLLAFSVYGIACLFPTLVISIQVYWQQTSFVLFVQPFLELLCGVLIYGEASFTRQHTWFQL